MVQHFNVLLIGDKNVGKKAFIHRSYYGGYIQNYNPSVGIETSQVLRYYHSEVIWIMVTTVNTFEDLESIKYNIHEYDAILFMFDLTSKASYYIINYWYLCLFSFFENKIVLFAGNKYDSKDSWEVDPDQLVDGKLSTIGLSPQQSQDSSSAFPSTQSTQKREKKLWNENYVFISVKSKYNLDFLWTFLIRKIVVHT